MLPVSNKTSQGRVTISPSPANTRLLAFCGAVLTVSGLGLGLLPIAGKAGTGLVAVSGAANSRDINCNRFSKVSVGRLMPNRLSNAAVRHHRARPLAQGCRRATDAQLTFQSRRAPDQRVDLALQLPQIRLQFLSLGRTDF